MGRAKKERRVYTPEIVNEMKRCSKDVAYFAKYIQLDKHGESIRWRDYQVHEFEIFQNYTNIICNWSRESGNRWVDAVCALWFLTFSSSVYCAILDVKAYKAKEMLALIKAMYMNLPWWLQKEAEFHKLYAIFGSGLGRSHIIVGSYASEPCRGRFINLLICRNFAFLHESIATNFVASIFPVQLSGKPNKCRMVISSCPNGKGNMFHHLWENCIKLPNENPVETRCFVGTMVSYTKDIYPYVQKDVSTTMHTDKYKSEYECQFLDK